MKKKPEQRTFHLTPAPDMNGAKICNPCWDGKHTSCHEMGCECWHHLKAKRPRAAKKQAEPPPELFAAGVGGIEV